MVRYDSALALTQPRRTRSGGARPLPHSQLKLSQLRMIVALEEHEMVSAAARAVNISQPAASRMIAEMESLLDVRLCERFSRGVRLTPMGQSLARHARSVLLQLSRAEQEIADERSGRGGVVSIGAVTGPAIDLAAPAITKIREWLPKIELNIKIDTSSVLARDLLSSRLDFIVARIPDDADPRLFDCLSIGPEQACLIVRGGHPLLAKSPVNLQQLSKFDWVMQARGTPLRRAIDNLFLAGNVALPERVLNTSSLLLTMILVAQSNAIAPISFEAAKFAAGGGGAGALEILPARFTVVLQPYSLISVRNRAMSPAAQSVFGLIRKQARI